MLAGRFTFDIHACCVQAWHLLRVSLFCLPKSVLQLLSWFIASTHRSTLVALNAISADRSAGLHQVLLCKMIQSHIWQKCCMSDCEVLAVLLCL